jgi:hypothetical protein
VLLRNSEAHDIDFARKMLDINSRKRTFLQRIALLLPHPHLKLASPLKNALRMVLCTEVEMQASLAWASLVPAAGGDAPP